DGSPVLEDGRVLDVANVIWCTGFRQDLGWLGVPVFGDDNRPVHERGVAAEAGLYFVGLDFLSAFTSENVGGVGRDARRLARQIEACFVPDPVPAVWLAEGELEEQVVLVVEVVEDRAVGEADLLLEAGNGRSVEAPFGEGPLRPGQDLVPAGVHVLRGSL